MTKLGLWRGKPLENMTRGELIAALIEQAKLYEEVLQAEQNDLQSKLDKMWKDGQDARSEFEKYGR